MTPTLIEQAGVALASMVLGEPGEDGEVFTLDDIIEQAKYVKILSEARIID